MKKLATISFFLISVFSFAQFPILSDTLLKPGIYKSFEEFRNNNPSQKLAGEIKSHNVKYNTNGSFEYLKVYFQDVEKEEVKSIGKVFGFSDGKNIYIVDGYNSKINDYAFYKLEFVNKLCYFYSIESAQVMDIYMETRVEKVLDLQTAEIQKLTNAVVKNIISDNKELLEKFKNQSKKHLYYKEYIINYLK